MILYLVRHAWAEDRDVERWPDDRHRPLTPKGIKRFSRVAKRLAKRGIEPKCVATSPLVRCVQTARILCERFELDEFAAIDELSPGANLQSVIDAARRLESEEVAWVGHAPDIGQLVAGLIGGNGAHIEMAKGAVAAIEFEGSIEPNSGNLLWMVDAKVLGA